MIGLRIVILILVNLALPACESREVRARRLDKDVCARIERKLAARVATHAADKDKFKAALNALRYATYEDEGYDRDEIDLGVIPMVSEIQMTHRIASALGQRCLTPSPGRRECNAPLEEIHLRHDPDSSFRQIESVRLGLLGEGSCAGSGRPGSVTACEIAARSLMADDPKIAELWPLKVGAGGKLSPLASSASDRVSEWRALVDYGLAIAPACLSPNLTVSCEGLRNGLYDAAPRELAARVNQLGEAFRDGKPCSSAQTAATR